jgi:RimJ/RimL family protein N-acetyltransferase
MSLPAYAAFETPRLSLRPHELADFDALAARWADPVVVRYLGNRPSTREQSWTRLLRYRGHWELCGFGFWSVRERASGACIGEVGIADFKRDLDEPIGIEAGWVLAPEAQGKGYATEAVRAALAWGKTHAIGREVWALVDHDNAASLAVARKCGFAEVRRTTYQGVAAVVLRAPL